MWALTINVVFMVVEVAGGVLANSLALLADAGHMVADVASLVLALIVLHLAGRPYTARQTFGLLRAEVLGALVNGVSLLVVAALIFREALHRYGSASFIDGPLMLAVALAGLAANLVSTAILAKDRSENINLQGAFLHMLGDVLGSFGAIIAGVVISLTGWYPVDLITSVAIGSIIFWNAIKFLRRTLNILLESAPEDVNTDDVRKSLKAMAHVEDVHDLHTWTITTGMPLLIAHLTLSPECWENNHWAVCIQEAKGMIRRRFGIIHTTLELEEPEHCEDRVCAFEPTKKSTS